MTCTTYWRTSYQVCPPCAHGDHRHHEGGDCKNLFVKTEKRDGHNVVTETKGQCCCYATDVETRLNIPEVDDFGIEV